VILFSLDRFINTNSDTSVKMSEYKNVDVINLFNYTMLQATREKHYVDFDCCWLR